MKDSIHLPMNLPDFGVLKDERESASIMVDTHAHLNHEQFDEDWKETVARARQASVKWVVNVGWDMPSSERAVRQAEELESIYAAVGIHPHHAQGAGEANLNRLRELARFSKKVIAVGETGLDFYRPLSPPDAQMRLFREHLALARELELPILIHVRQAHREAMGVVSQFGELPRGAVIHCFDGDVHEAQPWIEMGFHFYIGIAGLVTFPSRNDVRRVCAAAPADRLLVETDCPWLTPVPHRGKRNEPAFLRHVLEKVAEIRGCSFGEAERFTTQNAQRFFGLCGL